MLLKPTYICWDPPPPDAYLVDHGGDGLGLFEALEVDGAVGGDADGPGLVGGVELLDGLPLHRWAGGRAGVRALVGVRRVRRAARGVCGASLTWACTNVQILSASALGSVGGKCTRVRST
jgi:hypothetical protein